MGCLHPFRRTTFEWRRSPGCELAQVTDVDADNGDGSSRQQLLRQCAANTRVQLRRSQSDGGDPIAVEVVIPGGQPIGHLSAGIAAEVGPLLTSGQADFDAEIWTFDEFAGGDGRRLIGCTISITRFHRVPVERFVWSLAISSMVRGAGGRVRWTIDHGMAALGWVRRTSFAALRSMILGTDG